MLEPQHLQHLLLRSLLADMKMARRWPHLTVGGRAVLEGVEVIQHRNEDDDEVVSIFLEEGVGQRMGNNKQ